MNEINKQLLISIRKGAFNLLPGIGEILDDAFFETRNRIKQDRYNRFIDIIIDFLNSNSDRITFDTNIDNEDFSDVVEDVIRGVLRAASNEKLLRFRNLLFSYAMGSSGGDLIPIFIDLTNSLMDDQVIILQKYYQLKSKYVNLVKDKAEIESKLGKLKEDLKLEVERHKNGYANNLPLVERDVAKANHDLIEISRVIDIIRDASNSTMYGLEENYFKSIVQDLVSKALLTDIGMTLHGVNQFELLELTNLGYSYIEYLMKIESP